MSNLEFQIIDPADHKTKVLDLIKQLNPNMQESDIETLISSMIEVPNFKCFGLFLNQELIGISSGWTTVRIYCGKQLELDNVIIDGSIQSKGYGKYFMNSIKDWSVRNDYKSIGLNTYVQNSRSHKFYFNEGFKVLGFHFEKSLV